MDNKVIYVEDIDNICPKCGSRVFYELWTDDQDYESLVGEECEYCGTYYPARDYHWRRFGMPGADDDDTQLEGV